MAEIKKADVETLINMKLVIPPYQRPYRWDVRNIDDLLRDIGNAINDAKRFDDNFRYRIGTIILYKNKNGKLDIVDGQQRIISLILLNKYLCPDFECDLLKHAFTSKITQDNIQRNYTFIKEWFSLKTEAKQVYINAIKEILEVIVITVDKISEAFQLFDSQNARGKALDPHDLLKAYHLREMKNYRYEMKHAVTKWESMETSQIRELFDLYLFPIRNWSRGIKTRPFTVKEIDAYKGITEGSEYLFDKYIIKREYANDNADGQWSLKTLYASGQQSKKKPNYTNSKFTKSGEWDKTNDWRNRTIIMIQSAMRVSYTSAKVMHWITKALIWLSEDSCKHIKKDDITGFNAVIENMAKSAVKETFFDVCPDYVYKMGVNTPHIVFNYLDYLLWNNDREIYDNFTFEFRNSVEHWYPQNPSEGTFEQWKDDVDSFGNLCIIQRNVNSRFSNMAPEAKKSTFVKMIDTGSLKLRKMRDLTEKTSDEAAGQRWKNTLYKEHEMEMIKILKENCEANS